MHVIMNLRTNVRSGKHVKMEMMSCLVVIVNSNIVERYCAFSACGNKTNASKILTRKPEWKRPLGRH